MAHVNLILEERPASVLKKKRLAKPAVKAGVKKDKPVITQEGSAGVPEETAISTAPVPEVTEHHMEMRENDRDTIDQKAGSENQLR